MKKDTMLYRWVMSCLSRRSLNSKVTKHSVAAMREVMMPEHSTKSKPPELDRQWPLLDLQLIPEQHTCSGQH